MCGHFGVIYKGHNGFFGTHVEAFTDGLFIDTLRGADATGVCIVKNNGSAVVLKEASEASYFLQHTDVKKHFASLVTNGKALLGHNRKATVGKHTDENAHPFIVDDEFVFFHNGSLYNWEKLGYKTNVDSDALGQHIYNAIRAKEHDALSKALGEITGAYACVWHDMREETVCIIRNSQRPMFIVETDNAYYYGSELNMLRLAIERNGSQKIKAEAELPIDTLCTFNLRATYQDLKPSLKKVEIVKKYTPVTKTHTGTPAKHLGGKTKNFQNTTAAISKQQFKRWVKRNKGEEFSFLVEAVSKNGSTVVELEGFLDVDDGTIEFDDAIASAIVLEMSLTEACDKYLHTTVRASLIDATFESPDSIQLMLGSPKIVNKPRVCH